MSSQVESLESLLEKLSPAEVEEAKRILYGAPVQTLAITAHAAALAQQHDFEIKAFQKNAAQEQLRKPRIVRIGAIQNTVVLPTTAPFADQYAAIEKKVETMIEAAADMNVNVLCLQEGLRGLGFDRCFFLVLTLVLFSMDHAVCILYERKRGCVIFFFFLNLEKKRHTREALERVCGGRIQGMSAMSLF